MESQVFNNISGFNKAYKDIRKEIIISLGMDPKSHIRLMSGSLTLFETFPDMKNEKEEVWMWLPITSGTQAEMKNYITNKNNHQYKLVAREGITQR